MKINSFNETAVSRFILSSSGQLWEILILAILGQLGDWLRFVDLQDANFEKVAVIKKTTAFFSHLLRPSNHTYFLL